MKIKQLTANRLIIQIKEVSWIAVAGCVAIFLGICYRLSLDSSFLFIFIPFTMFLLLGLVIALSTKSCKFDKLSRQIVISSYEIFVSRVNKIAWSDIADVQVEKTNAEQDDVGSVRYEVCFYLTSGKKLELGYSDQEKQAQQITQQIREFLIS